MLNQISACILKQIWGTINNVKKLIISIVSNCLLIIWFFFRTRENAFLGMNFTTIIFLYVLVWVVMISFTLVNDIITETNNIGILEQIFMSSCSIVRYTFIQIIIKSGISIFFITLILSICNFVTNTFSKNFIASFLLTLTIGIFSILGAGYIVSSFSLLINNKNISLLLRMVLLILILKSNNNLLIPFSHCKDMVVDLFGNGTYLWNQSNVKIVGLIVNSIVYFVIGIFIFSIVTSKKMMIKEDYK